MPLKYFFTTSNFDLTFIISKLLFSRSVASDFLQPHWLQHARLPCQSLSLWVCSDSHPLSRWCHPTISSSVTPSSPALNLSQDQSLFQWVISFPSLRVFFNESFKMFCFNIFPHGVYSLEGNIDFKQKFWKH